MAEPEKLSGSEIIAKLLESKIASDEWLRGLEMEYHARNYIPPGRRGAGLLILGPTRRWAMEIASIVNVHPQERYVRVASYDDPGALMGLSPAGIIMAVPDQFVLKPEISSYLIPMMRDLAMVQR